MEQILFIVLGALLALMGGVLTQVYQNNVLRKREDRELLLRALDLLIEIEPILDSFPTAQEDAKKLCTDIFSIARRIQTKRYRGISEDLVEFSLKNVKQTKEEANRIIDELRSKISIPFDVFHKKEKEFFKKVATEIKKMREASESDK